MATFGTNLGAALLALVNVVVTARALGPSGRGQLALLTTMALLAATLASLGVEESNGNLAAIEPRSRRALAANSILLALLFGVVASGAVAALIAAFPAVGGHSSPWLRLLALSSVPLFILQIYFQFLIRADYGFAFTNVAVLVGPMLIVGVNSVLAGLGQITVGTAVATWVAAQAVGTAILGWYIARGLAGFGKPDRELALRSVGFGLKSHAGRVMKEGNYRLDQWLLGAMAGSRELGLYSVAVAWSEALFYLPEAIGMVMRPDVVRAAPDEAGRRTATVFRIAVLLTVPLVVALVIAAPILCVTAFGHGFMGSIGDLRVLAPGAFGIVALKLFSNALTAQRKPMLGNVALGVAFVATVGLDLFLIPRYGGLGAALASTVSYTAGGIAIAVIFARALGIHLSEFVPRARDVLRFSFFRSRAAPGAGRS